MWCGAWGLGGSLRFIRDLDFAQDRFAPLYVDAFGAYVFEGSGIRHGVGLDVSTNLSEDGAGRLGVDPLNQWVISPTYVAYLDVTPFLRVQGKAGLPFSFGPAFAPESMSRSVRCTCFSPGSASTPSLPPGPTSVRTWCIRS